MTEDTLKKIRSLETDQIVRYRCGRLGREGPEWDPWTEGPLYVAKRTKPNLLNAPNPYAETGAVLLVSPQNAEGPEYSEADWDDAGHFAWEENLFEIDWRSCPAEGESTAPAIPARAALSPQGSGEPVPEAEKSEGGIPTPEKPGMDEAGVLPTRKRPEADHGDIRFESGSTARGHEGGQQCGLRIPWLRATHEATGNVIILNDCRSQGEARRLAASMFAWMEAEMRGDQWKRSGREETISSSPLSPRMDAETDPPGSNPTSPGRSIPEIIARAKSE